MLGSLKVPSAVLHMLSACAVAIPLFAHADVCISLSGKARLDVDPGCKIGATYPGPVYLGQLGVPNSCFSIQMISPMLTASGNAGVTSESTLSLVSGAGQTPAIANEAGVTPITNEFGMVETRRFFTGRSVISLIGGKIYTADAGVMNGDGESEQLIVTGGEGLYAKAKGTFYVSGKTIGQWGNFNGQLCYSK